MLRSALIALLFTATTAAADPKAPECPALWAIASSLVGQMNALIGLRARIVVEPVNALREDREAFDYGSTGVALRGVTSETEAAAQSAADAYNALCRD